MKDYVSYGSLGCKQIHGNREQNCGLLRAGVLWGKGELQLMSSGLSQGDKKHSGIRY